MRSFARTLVPALIAVVVLVPATPGRAEVRIITGPGISPPPVLEGAPERVAPPKPPAEPPAPIVERRLGPVVVESAAEIRAGRLRIRLAGVEAVARDEVCRDGNGEDWACGRRALAAVRRLVRLRPVACLLPSDARRGAYDAACTLAGEDLGRQFVAAGWARATAGGPLVAAEADAKAAGRGLWGAAPVVAPLPDLPAPSDALPPDLTTAPLADGAETRPGETPAGPPMVVAPAPGR